MSISEETRERVLLNAKSLGYVPQAAARALVKGRSRTIGVILLDPHAMIFRDPYLPNVIGGMTDVAAAQGYRLLVERIPNNHDLTVVRALLKGGEVDGVVILNSNLPNEITTALHREGYPILLLDTLQPWGLPTVMIDHLGGVRAVARHLIALGHRRIGCIPYFPLEEAHVRARFDAFTDTLKSAGISLHERLVVPGLSDPETGAAAMRQILSQGEPPTAVFGMNDMMALGAMSACAEAGIRVPEDIAIVGYDDMRFAAFTNPPLTTVRAPEVELGRASAEALLAMIHGTSATIETRHLPSQLIVRKSCGASASGQA